jgi:hypothetical protein
MGAEHGDPRCAICVGGLPDFARRRGATRCDEVAQAMVPTLIRAPTAEPAMRRETLVASLLPRSPPTPLGGRLNPLTQSTWS